MTGCDQLYLDLLRLHRPAYGQGENAMRQRICEFVKNLGRAAQIDRHGNVSVHIGDSRTMFTCHMDSATRQEGEVKLMYTQTGFITADGSILGADDASGIYILLNMIRADVPGHYYFFHAEEVGGIGSHNLAHDESFDYEMFDRAIAFDRAGTKDVITHQGDRCCSQVFASALANQLGMGYRPDDTGIFTDTANFTDLIPECTNISVGYANEHTVNEIQDWRHLQALTERVKHIDWESLPTARDVDADLTETMVTAHDLVVPDIEEVVRASPDLVSMMLVDMGYDKYELINTLYDYHLLQEQDDDEQQDLHRL